MPLDQKKLSKTMSWLLRYGATEAGLDLDEGGSVSVDDMLGLPNFSRYSKQNVLDAIKDNDKQRFELIGDEPHLRVKVKWGQSPEMLARASDFEIVDNAHQTSSKPSRCKQMHRGPAPSAPYPTSLDVLSRLDALEGTVLREAADKAVAEKLSNFEARLSRMEQGIADLVRMMEQLQAKQ
mmetsp:Transcript_15553/g.31340  ORF Transcript_15553/g.31340 Transcript_15553/m.31340 type:complete len:180 (+) Transcript_15553:65-604(+)